MAEGDSRAARTALMSYLSDEAIGVWFEIQRQHHEAIDEVNVLNEVLRRVELAHIDSEFVKAKRAALNQCVEDMLNTFVAELNDGGSLTHLKGIYMEMRHKEKCLTFLEQNYTQPRIMPYSCGDLLHNLREQRALLLVTCIKDQLRNEHKKMVSYAHFLELEIDCYRYIADTYRAIIDSYGPVFHNNDNAFSLSRTTTVATTTD